MFPSRTRRVTAFCRLVVGDRELLPTPKCISMACRGCSSMLSATIQQAQFDCHSYHQYCGGVRVLVHPSVKKLCFRDKLRVTYTRALTYTCFCRNYPRLSLYVKLLRSCDIHVVQEMEVLGLAAASLLSKYRKIATFDELLDKLFFHGKSSVAILLFFVGVPHSVSYILIWTGKSF